jgi:uncharacterized RDD family membrane protein YckC
VTPGDEDGPALPIGATLTSLGRRGVALVLDWFVVAVPLIPVAVALALSGHEFDRNELVVLSAVSVAATVAYQTVCVAMWSRTLGKLAMSCRVVRSDDGSRLGWSAAAVRSLVPAVAGAVPGIGPVLLVPVYGTAAIDVRRQGLHDKAAGSLVVDSGVARTDAAA